MNGLVVVASMVENNQEKEFLRLANSSGFWNGDVSSGFSYK